jgi:hypothetical protein
MYVKHALGTGGFATSCRPNHPAPPPPQGREFEQPRPKQTLQAASAWEEFVARMGTTSQNCVAPVGQVMDSVAPVVPFMVVALIEWQYEVGPAGEEHVRVAAAVVSPPRTAANDRCASLVLSCALPCNGFATSPFMRVLRAEGMPASRSLKTAFTRKGRRSNPEHPSGERTT